MELLHFTIGDGFSQDFHQRYFHVARAALQFRVETFESQLSTRLAAGRQNVVASLLLLWFWLAVSNWNGEADEDGASTRWSEANERANERASERASGWTYAASATVAAGATSRQTSFTHNQTGAHTRMHAIVLCVCVEVGVALAACALSLSCSLSLCRTCRGS